MASARRRRSPWGVALALALGGVAPARAQELPTQDPAGFVGFTSTRMPGPWRIDSSVVLSYALDPWAVPTSSGADAAQVRYQVGVDFARLRLGLGGRGALRVSVPVVAATQGAGSQPGMADGEVAAQVRILGAPADARGDTPEGAGVQVEIISSLPWGWAETLEASPRPRLEGALTADMHAFGVVAGVRGGYARYLSAPTSGLGVDRLSLSVGAQVPVLLFGRRRPEQLTEHVLLDFAIETEPQHFFARGYTEIEGRAALRFRAGDWLVSCGLAVGMLRTRETPRLSAFVSLGNSPRPHDADLDGVPDGADLCPELTEDLDGFEDGDGCPEPDNDQDGILDEDDRCPLEPAPWDQDADEDGCRDRRPGGRR